VVAEVQRQVDALTLRAPFDGQVGQVHATQRTQVAANAPVLGVVDLTRFEVEIRVPESFARDLAIGMPAQLTSGNGTPVAAEVAAVSPEVVGGEVTARLRFAGDQPPGLRQSQRLSARILLDTRKNVLKLSRGPFVEVDGGRHAWVVDGHTARRTPVRLGVQSLGEVEVLDGLSEGQTIVIAGTELFGKAEQVTLN
jgi:HlyD family secretion protein